MISFGERRSREGPAVHERLPSYDDGFARMVFATSLTSRLRGLLFVQPHDFVMVLAPCRDVHTFGMHYAVDVAFLDDSGKVVEVHRDVLPNRRLRNRAAVAVAERFADQRQPWYELGDRLFQGAWQEAPSFRE